MTKKNFSNPKAKAHSDAKNVWLYGYHAATAALRNPKRTILRVLMTKETAAEVVASGISVEYETVARADLDKLLPAGAVHQGIAIMTAPLPDVYVDDLPDKDRSVIVLLDQVTDPHNVGAILRSAAAFGADAVLVTERNAPEATGTLAKAASGCLELVPLIPVTNLSRTMNDLKKRGYWCVGMDGYADKTLHDADLPPKIVLVMGSEGYGMRRLTAENCDFTVKLPISPSVESLNVSTAAAVALYDLSLRR